MGQIKMEIINNYFVVTDVATSKHVFDPIPSKDIRYVNDRETIHFYGSGSDRRKYGFDTGFMIGLTGTMNLDAGASGSVDSITIGGVEIMSGSVAFDTDLATTATNVAVNITANTSNPNYSATSSGALVTIKIETLHVEVDGLAVVSSATTITTTDINMGVSTGNIIDSNDASFASLIDLTTFLSVNTGKP